MNFTKSAARISLPFQRMDPLLETGVRARMAGRAGLQHTYQERVAVAVQ